MKTTATIEEIRKLEEEIEKLAFETYGIRNHEDAIALRKRIGEIEEDFIQNSNNLLSA
jgi:hypothetical protein